MQQNTPLEELARRVVEAAFRVQGDLGPGLLESVYEAALAKVLSDCGLKVERGKAVPVEYAGERFDEGLFIDLLVEGVLPVELKAVDRFLPVHDRQVLTSLRLLNLPLGLLINFDSGHPSKWVRRIGNPLAAEPVWGAEVS